MNQFEKERRSTFKENCSKLALICNLLRYEGHISQGTYNQIDSCLIGIKNCEMNDVQVLIAAIEEMPFVKNGDQVHIEPLETIRQQFILQGPDKYYVTAIKVK